MLRREDLQNRPPDLKRISYSHVQGQDTTDTARNKYLREHKRKRWKTKAIQTS